MAIRRATQRTTLLAALFGFCALAACDDHDEKVSSVDAGTPGGDAATPITGIDSGSAPVVEPKYVLASVTIAPDSPNSRTTYLQRLQTLSGNIVAKQGIEFPGNAAFIYGGGKIFAAHAEEPTFERFGLDAQGKLVSEGKLSFLATGAGSPGYAHAYVDAENAVTLLAEQFTVVVWNPTTMTIKGEIDLPHLNKAGFDLEAWPVTAHQGRVYIPTKWLNWDASTMLPGVSLTIIDPKAMSIVAVAEDPRCTAGGSPVWDDKGYGYVMADGRTYSDKSFALAKGQPAPPDHCILRMAPGQTTFEQSYYYTIPALTGGLESIAELSQAAPGSNVGFARLFDATKLPAGKKPDDFSFWQLPVHRMYSFTLTDPPVAKPVEGMGYSTVGFTNIPLNGKVYMPESPDDTYSDVYEVDPATSTATLRFRVDGSFYGLYDLSK
ncbi:MAG: hypothetical protein ABW252_07130 [Polyangiales bacterium]